MPQARAIVTDSVWIVVTLDDAGVTVTTGIVSAVTVSFAVPVAEV